MAEQCAHSSRWWIAPGITLHVVPKDDVGLSGAFDIAARDGMATVNLTTIRDVSSTASDLVDETTQSWERILGAALPCAESVDFVRAQEDQWKKHI